MDRPLLYYRIYLFKKSVILIVMKEMFGENTTFPSERVQAFLSAWQWNISLPLALVPSISRASIPPIGARKATLRWLFRVEDAE